MVRRTNINLDVELLDQAAKELGTTRMTDTVHAAMREVVRRAALKRLSEHDFPDLTPEFLAEMRAPRTFDAP